MRHISLVFILTLLLGACATTKTPQEIEPSVSVPEDSTPIITQRPVIPVPATVTEVFPDEPTPPKVAPAPPPPSENAFRKLPHWRKSDVRPAMAAFRRSCEVWNKKDQAKAFSANHPEFGILADWKSLCSYAYEVEEDNSQEARDFFETHFYPLLLGDDERTGLLTGYYQPEVEVRAEAENEFSEPILSVPLDKKDIFLPRSEISEKTARVIAYGRPMDVFFMQIQGSGILAFENGYRVRAAYGANNGYPYTSIGSVLVKRGDMTMSEASKQAIERWMLENGPEAARALMNENKRYVFFTEETLVKGEGPKGAMQAPLTAMGSLAVDPKHHPYGLPIWLTVKLPQKNGDYEGKTHGQLVIAQDTGKAIVGPQRGDIYFGAGYDAGAKAGVMKHRGQWAILIPRSLMGLIPVS